MASTSNNLPWVTRVHGFCRKQRLPEALHRVCALDDEARKDIMIRTRNDALVDAFEWLAAMRSLCVDDGFGLYVTRLGDLTPQQRRQCSDAARRLAVYAFEQHAFLRRLLRSRQTPPLHQLLVDGSWTHVVCSTYLMLLWEKVSANDDDDEVVKVDFWPALVARTALEFPYVAMLLKSQRPNILLSTDPIGVYTLSEFHQTLNGFLHIVYTTGWTPSTHRLLAALFARYAMFLQGSDLEAKLDIDRPLYLDDPHYVTTTPAAAAAATGDAPALPCGLQPAFVQDFERRFFYALCHSRAAASVVTDGRPFLLRCSQAWNVRVLEALQQLVADVVADSRASSDLTNTVHERMHNRVLWPGDMELTPVYDETDEADDLDATQAIYVLHRPLLPLLAEKQIAPLGEWIATWAEAWKRDILTPFYDPAFRQHWEEEQRAAAADEEEEEERGSETSVWPHEPFLAHVWEHMAVFRPPDERLILLLVVHALDTFATIQDTASYRFEDRMYADDASLPYPRCVPPQSVSRAFDAFADSRPFFVAYNHVYAVGYTLVNAAPTGDAMDIDEPAGAVPEPRRVVDFSPSLVEMLLRWVQVAWQQGHLKSSHVHPLLLPLLEHMPSLGS